MVEKIAVSDREKKAQERKKIERTTIKRKVDIEFKWKLGFRGRSRALATGFCYGLFDSCLYLKLTKVNHGRKFRNQKESCPVEHPFFTERQWLHST